MWNSPKKIFINPSGIYIFFFMIFPKRQLVSDFLLKTSSSIIACELWVYATFNAFMVGFRTRIIKRRRDLMLIIRSMTQNKVRVYACERARHTTKNKTGTLTCLGPDSQAQLILLTTSLFYGLTFFLFQRNLTPKSC